MTGPQTLGWSSSSGTRTESFHTESGSVWSWFWSWRETVNRDRALILWMTGPEQTLKLSNKRPQSSSPSPPSTPLPKRGAHYVTHQPSQSLTGSQLKEWRGFGGLCWGWGVTWSTEACLPQQGANEGETQRESFPPTHSQLHGSHRPPQAPNQRHHGNSQTVFFLF